MGCEEYNELICAVIDGEASAEARERLFAHMEECPECRALFDRMRAVSAEMREMEVDPPEFLASGILYKVGLEPAKKRRSFAFGRFTALAAAIALVILLSRNVLPRLHETQSTGGTTGTAELMQEEGTMDTPTEANFALPPQSVEPASGETETDKIDLASGVTNGEAEMPAVAPMPGAALTTDRALTFSAREELEARDDGVRYYCAAVFLGDTAEELEGAQLLEEGEGRRVYRVERSVFFRMQETCRLVDSYFDDMTSNDVLVVVYDE